MAQKDVHYEVFLKKHRKGSWALVEAREDRHEAAALAESLQRSNPAGSVRVTREDYDESARTFRSVTILETGAERFSDPAAKTGEATLPCVAPADLAGPAARDTLRRVLGPWLERHDICPMELLHRPDMIERLDSSDNDLQHAVQKVAVARAQNSDASVHAYVRLINDLVQRGIDQARREAKTRRGPPKAASFAELTEKILAEGSPEKRLRTAIADQLSECRGMGAKTERLLDMLAEVPVEPEARAFAETQADAFLAEIMTFEHAIKALVGRTADAGEEVVRLTTLYEGRDDHPDLQTAPESARRLATLFKQRALPATHCEIAARILTALRSPKRFKPNSVLQEIKLARELAQRLIAASGPNLHPDSLVEAFTHRSARLLAPEAIEEALTGAATPADEIERLLAMEDNIVGDSNKKKLAAYVRAKVTANNTGSWFCRGPGQPLERLGRLTTLQRRALAGTFPQVDKDEMAAAFDELGLAVLGQTRILERVTESNQPALDRVAALLKLAAQGLLPAGRCTLDAHARAMRLLSSSMGRAEAAAPESAERLAQVRSLLAAMRPDAHSDEDAA